MGESCHYWEREKFVCRLHDLLLRKRQTMEIIEKLKAALAANFFQF